MLQVLHKREERYFFEAVGVVRHHDIFAALDVPTCSKLKNRIIKERERERERLDERECVHVAVEL